MSDVFDGMTKMEVTVWKDKETGVTVLINEETGMTVIIDEDMFELKYMNYGDRNSYIWMMDLMERQSWK